MNYTIILGFTQGSQSTAGHLMVSIGLIKDRAAEEETVQQTTMAMIEQLHLQGNHGMDQDDVLMEETHNRHKYG